jgi:NADPH2:quinone reductase
MKVVKMRGPGGVEVLEYADESDPVAGPSQVLVQVAAAGVNFMDIPVRQRMTTSMPFPARS